MLIIRQFGTIPAVKPLKRPFADWVDDRMTPAIRYFAEEHPVISFMTIAGFWGGIRFGIRGEWLWFVGLAVMEAVFAAYLGIGWDARRRQRRLEELRARHICVHCGYDMRATPDMCSECGRRADEEVKPSPPSFNAAEFFGEFMEAHPIFAMLIVVQILATVPLLMRGGAGWFFEVFGLVDLLIGAWIVLDWERSRQQNTNKESDSDRR